MRGSTWNWTSNILVLDAEEIKRSKGIGGAEKLHWMHAQKLSQMCGIGPPGALEKRTL